MHTQQLRTLSHLQGMAESAMGGHAACSLTGAAHRRRFVDVKIDAFQLQLGIGLVEDVDAFIRLLLLLQLRKGVAALAAQAPGAACARAGTGAEQTGAGEKAFRFTSGLDLLLYVCMDELADSTFAGTAAEQGNT